MRSRTGTSALSALAVPGDCRTRADKGAICLLTNVQNFSIFL